MRLQINSGEPPLSGMKDSYNNLKINLFNPDSVDEANRKAPAFRVKLKVKFILDISFYFAL